MNSIDELPELLPHRELPPRALALELSRAERALSSFGAGQVDSVMDDEGFVYLLRGAQQNVLRSAARFDELFASIPDVVTVLDEAGEIVYHSPALTSVLGYARDALLGRAFAFLVHAEDQVELTLAAAKVTRRRGAS